MLENNELMKEIEKDLAAIETPQAPMVEIGKDDTVVGEATEAIKKLFTLRMTLQAANQMAMIQHMLIGTPPTREVIEDDFKLAIVDSLLWYEVRREFNLWDVERTGIRKNWEVVKGSTKENKTVFGQAGFSATASKEPVIN